jgi:hypothetical protein
MSSQIQVAFNNLYSANIMLLVQQKGSRLKDAVRQEVVEGEIAYFDQIGAGSAIKRQSRHADTPLTETPHARRQVMLEDYEYSDLIDRLDQVKTLTDPTSAYSQAAAHALGRAMDDVIIANANGTARSGKTGQTSVPLPVGQKIAVAASGLTLAKLLQAKEILDAAENDPDEPRYIACPAKDITVLLSNTQVTSSDYNTVKALAAGQIDTFLGFKFIRTQRLGTHFWRRPRLPCLAAVGAGAGHRPDAQGEGHRAARQILCDAGLLRDVGRCHAHGRRRRRGDRDSCLI